MVIVRIGEQNEIAAPADVLCASRFDDWLEVDHAISLTSQVTEASDGWEALRKAQELEPDLILLDVSLPNLNGMEVARRVRKLAPALKILFLTLETSSDVIREALSLGALGYVNKSRAQTDLLPALDLLLAGKRFVSSGLRFSEGTEGQAPRGQETLFYSDDSVLTEGLTRFVGSALSAGKAAMVWAIESHRDRLLQRLRAGGVDIDGAIDRGLYM